LEGHDNRCHTPVGGAVPWHQLRRWAALLLGSALAASGACSGDPAPPDRASNAPATTSTTTPGRTSTSVTALPPPPGSVTLTAFGVPLAEPGLRVLPAPGTKGVRVGIEVADAGSNGALACPVDGPASPPPEPAGCVRADPGRPVDIALEPGARGVLLRPPTGSEGPVATIAEVTFTYLPTDDSVTLVTPVLGPPADAGECVGGPCEMSFRLSPTGKGTFVLDADGRNSRAQLTVEAGDPGAAGSHVLATVGGGGRLRVTSSLDGRSDARLVVRNLGPAALPPVEIHLRWPTPR
jgi:hypothetical protein